MVANINKLKGKIAENGYTMKSLSKEIGMSETTLRRKINFENQDFTIGESQKVREKLNLNVEEYLYIFFNEELELNS